MLWRRQNVKPLSTGVKKIVLGSSLLYPVTSLFSHLFKEDQTTGFIFILGNARFMCGVMSVQFQRLHSYVVSHFNTICQKKWVGLVGPSLPWQINNCQRRGHLSQWPANGLVYAGQIRFAIEMVVLYSTRKVNTFFFVSSKSETLFWIFFEVFFC